MSANNDRFEIIDHCDIIVATAQTLEDARQAVASYKARHLSQWATAYIFDTLKRKVIS